MISESKPCCPKKGETETGPKMNVIVTGFGPFRDITENPSEMILKELKDSYADGAIKVEKQALEVNANSCDSFINKHKEEICKKENIPVVFLHMGVDANSWLVKLEKQYVNRRIFDLCTTELCCADSICKKSEYNSCVHSGINVDKLAKLAEEAELKVKTSENAGDYLCNYLGYMSTTNLQCKDVYTLFVHVTEFYSIPKEEQVKIIEWIITNLPKCLDGKSCE